MYNGAISGADEDAIIDAQNRYGYPVDCTDGQNKLQQVNEMIAITERDIAAGVTDRVGKRYLIAYNLVKSDLESFLQTCPPPSIETPGSGGDMTQQPATGGTNSKTMLWVAIGAGLLFYAYKKKLLK